MNSHSPKILVAAFLMENGIQMLKRSFSVEIEQEINRSKLLNIIHKYEGIIVRGTCSVDKELIDKAVKLRVIGTCGSGVNHIDIDYAQKKGIKIFNVKGINAYSVAELTIGILINLYRKVCLANYNVHHNGEWNKFNYLGGELAGKNLGIIGYGAIGQRLRELAMAFNVKVFVYDPYIIRPCDSKLNLVSNIHELLETSDVVTIHVPLTTDTYHLISDAELVLMRKGSYVINMSRGGVVDEEAILKAINENHLAGYGADVLEEEINKPVEKQNTKEIKSCLLGNSHCLFTPHIGAWTFEAQSQVAEEISNKIINYLIKGVE